VSIARSLRKAGNTNREKRAVPVVAAVTAGPAWPARTEGGAEASSRFESSLSFCSDGPAQAAVQTIAESAAAARTGKLTAGRTSR
jgi:hypothetical protein